MKFWHENVRKLDLCLKYFRNTIFRQYNPKSPYRNFSILPSSGMTFCSMSIVEKAGGGPIDQSKIAAASASSLTNLVFTISVDEFFNMLRLVGFGSSSDRISFPARDQIPTLENWPIMNNILHVVHSLYYIWVLLYYVLVY